MNCRLIIFLFFMPTFVFSQFNENLIYLNDIEKYNSQEIMFFGFINNDTITISRPDHKSNNIIYKNNRAVGSIKAEINISDIIVYDNPVLIIEVNHLNNELNDNIILNLETGQYTNMSNKLKYLGYIEGKLIGGIQKSPDFYGVGKYIDELVFYDINSNNIIPFIKIDNKDEEFKGVINILPFPKTNNLIFSWSECYLEFYQCEFVTYYSVDLNNNNSVEKLKYQRESREFKSFPMIENNLNYIIENYTEYIVNEINHITNVLPKSTNLIGWNYNNSKQVSYNFISVIDSVKYRDGNSLIEVLVPYRFDISLENVFYMMYHDIQLSKDDIIEFERHELLLIKNFIYAKHNFNFNSRFYQAFFNLFEFYNNDSKRSSRTTDIKSLFSASDDSNLELIKNALKDFE